VFVCYSYKSANCIKYNHEVANAISRNQLFDALDEICVFVDETKAEKDLEV
jgi:hypothetical protein